VRAAWEMILSTTELLHEVGIQRSNQLLAVAGTSEAVLAFGLVILHLRFPLELGSNDGDAYSQATTPALF
jgi:hypothetical protein